MKQHKTRRTVSTNPFNNQRFKGNNEVLQDWDLSQKLYIMEPETLAELREKLRTGEVTEQEYKQVYDKIGEPGTTITNLVPYEEMPEVDVMVLSQAGDIDDIEFNKTIAVVTNVKVPNITTKRYYTFNKPPTVKAEITDDIYEENNFNSIINTDDSIKQTSWTLEKVVRYMGGDSSSYVEKIFRVNDPRPKNIKYISYEDLGSSSIIGEIVIKNKINKSIDKKFLFDNSSGNFSWINDDGTLVESDTYLDVHFLIPNVTDSEVKFRTPWVWEYLFAKHQFGGTYRVYWENGGKEETSTPDNAPDSTNLYPGATLSYREYDNRDIGVFDGSERELMAAAYLGFVTRWALPVNISSHAAKVEQNDLQSLGAETSGSGALTGAIEGITKAIMGFDSSDLKELGLRIVQNKGVWARNSSIFVWDFAWDPNGFNLIIKTFKFWLSDIQYGAFYRSSEYRKLINGIINGTSVYNGTEFNSKLGIMDEIEHVEVDPDLTNFDDRNQNLFLLPYSITELAGGDNWKTENMLNDLPIIGPTYAREDKGLLNKASTLRTNSLVGFYGQYINPEVFKSSEYRNNKGVLELENVEDISGWAINRFGAKQFKLRFFDENKNLIKTETFKTEQSKGKDMSGGGNINWL